MSLAQSEHIVEQSRARCRRILMATRSQPAMILQRLLASTNGLEGTGFASWYRLQPRAGL